MGTVISEAVCDRSGERAGLSAAFRFLREGAIATLGLVVVPKETKGDSELSLGRVLITGAIGDRGWSWEMWSMSGVGLGLERQDASSLDME